jgi:nucleoid-associated protein YgaU
MSHAYVIQAGDSPWKIAERLYGNGKHAAAIMKANPNVDSKRLVAGKTLIIPPIPGLILKTNLPLASGTASPVAAEPIIPEKVTTTLNAPVAIAGEQKGTVHVIRANDTYVAIARRHYGSSSNELIEKLRKANPDVDPRRLAVGQTVFVPAKE